MRTIFRPGRHAGSRALFDQATAILARLDPKCVVVCATHEPTAHMRALGVPDAQVKVARNGATVRTIRYDEEKR